MKTKQFASDNYSGICPEALQAMIDANNDHQSAYGHDTFTEQACEQFRELFEIDCEVFFAFNGTAANSMATAHLCRSYNSIICHELAHVETDECGAPEFFSNGAKILLASGEQGKVTPGAIEAIINRREDIHYPKPRIISLTQATEVGTVYTPDELKGIHHTAMKHHLHLHMDGARFANAVASLNVTPKEITWQCGVDVLCFGGTKNGMAVGEAVIFFNRELAADFDYRCKQAGQLASKMRFLSAPWLGMLQHDTWLTYAAHANSCAERLAQHLAGVDHCRLMFPRQANAVFAELPPPALDSLRRKGWQFYTFIGLGGARFMCSWDTTFDLVDELTDDIKEAIEKTKS